MKLNAIDVDSSTSQLKTKKTRVSTILANSSSFLAEDAAMTATIPAAKNV